MRITLIMVNLKHYTLRINYSLRMNERTNERPYERLKLNSSIKGIYQKSQLEVITLYEKKPPLIYSPISALLYCIRRKSLSHRGKLKDVNLKKTVTINARKGKISLYIRLCTYSIYICVYIYVPK